MQRAVLLAAALLAAAPAACAADAPADVAPPGNAAHGKTLFYVTGCYQCHGVEGVTGGPGGRLAPDPRPFAAVMGQLRHPAARMPIYTAEVMSDQDIADIYAYLKSQPKVKQVADIPLLSR